MIKIPKASPISDQLKNRFLSALDPIINLSTKLNVHPSTFTTVGFLLSCIASYFIAIGSLRLGSSIILLAGLCDALDGRLARHTGKVTNFGALYDSTLDRYSEVVYFFGMAFYFIDNSWYLTSIAVAVGLGGSMMVSYVRARAEGLGFKCNIGLLQRAERLLLLGFGGLIHIYIYVAAIWIVAIFSNITAIQRVVYILREDRNIQTKASGE